MNEWALFGCREVGAAARLLFQGTMGQPLWTGGAVPGCLRGEVTRLCALLTGSMLAQARLMPASRHFLAGNSPLPPPLPPPAHLGPACLQPGLLSLPWVLPWDGLLGFSLPSSSPKDLGPPCAEQSEKPDDAQKL